MKKQEKKHRNIRVTAKKQRNKKEQNRRNTVGIQKPNIQNFGKNWNPEVFCPDFQSPDHSKNWQNVLFSKLGTSFSGILYLPFKNWKFESGFWMVGTKET